MKILALEFSSPQRSVAIARADGSPSANRSVISEVVETGVKGNAPLLMIEETLRHATLEREQIDCIAVGLGPGSYTGIRAAIALAQGWQLARQVKLLGISTADCLTEQARSDGLRGRISIVIDAQREEFYLATYELDDKQSRELEPLRIATCEVVGRSAANGSTLIGPEVTNWFPSGKTIFPHAATLAQLALKRNDFVPGEKLEPIYLRETKFVKAPPPRIIS
jgi:tRNA threonylcarbamoyl adenosine modification protein YeaZ